MNKKEFYCAFKKSVTCAITCLIIFFSAIFCFYTGYKFGRERVLDCDPVEVSSFQTQSFKSQSLIYNDGLFNFDGNYVYQNSWVYEGVDTDGSYSGWRVDKYFFCKYNFSVSSSGLYISLYDLDGHNFSSNILVNNGWQYSQIVVSSEISFFRIHIYKDNDFDYNNIVTYRYCGVRKWGDTGTLGYDNELIDINGKVLYFGFLCRDYSKGFDWVSNMIFDWVYYDVSSISTDSYKQGFDTGYNEGKSDGFDDGYRVGYNNGYGDGVGDGYNDGVNATNTYSFSNLLTAVVNAPVSVFTNLLDFNIMGFNLLSLVAGLLTLGLIVLIIKLCLGGK